MGDRTDATPEAVKAWIRNAIEFAKALDDAYRPLRNALKTRHRAQPQDE